MQTSMTRLNKVISAAGAGQSKLALELFQKMGISLTELRTGNAATLLPKIASAFQLTENTALRAHMATTLFGRSGQELTDMLALGPTALREMGTELDRLGYHFSAVDDNNLTAFRLSWIGMQTAVGGFTNMLGARLSPALTPVVGQFRDWIVANREWLASQITEKVGEFVGWLRAVDWNALGRSIRDWMTAAGEFIDKIGGVKVALLAVIGLSFAPLLVSIGTVIAAVGRMAAAILAIPGIPGVPGAPAAVPRVLPPLVPLALPLALSGDTAPSHMTPEAEQATRAKIDQQERASREWWDSKYKAVGSWLRSATAWPGDASPDAAPAGVLPRLAPPGAVPAIMPSLLPGALPGSGTAPLQLPSLYAPSSAPGAPGAPGAQGSVDVNVKFANAPPGTQVDVRSAGQVRAPPAEVGYAFGFERAALA